MINVNDIFLADLQDDFELAGRENAEFSIYDFINNDLNRAFGVGFSYQDWLNTSKLWIPVTVRKEMRHVSDDMEVYNPQFEWLNKKFGIDREVVINDYATFILDNIFSNEDDIIKLAIIIGSNLKPKNHE